MELGVGDRIVLLSLLPREGDLTTIRIVHELRQALSFTEEEHKALNIRSEGDVLAWDGVGGTKEIPIGPHAHVLISDALKKLNDEGQVTEDHLGVWEKFGDDKEAHRQTD